MARCGACGGRWWERDEDGGLKCGICGRPPVRREHQEPDKEHTPKAGRKAPTHNLPERVGASDGGTLGITTR